MRRRRAVGGRGPARLIPSGLPKKLLLSTGLGLAQHAGYLARIPAVGTLAAETVLGGGIIAARRLLGIGNPLLDDLAEVCLIVASNRAGSRGLAALTGTRAVSGLELGAEDPYAVHGPEDYTAD